MKDLKKVFASSKANFTRMHKTLETLPLQNVIQITQNPNQNKCESIFQHVNPIISPAQKVAQISNKVSRIVNRKFHGAFSNQYQFAIVVLGGKFSGILTICKGTSPRGVLLSPRCSLTRTRRHLKTCAN